MEGGGKGREGRQSRAVGWLGKGGGGGECRWGRLSRGRLRGGCSQVTACRKRGRKENSLR